MKPPDLEHWKVVSADCSFLKLRGSNVCIDYDEGRLTIYPDGDLLRIEPKAASELIGFLAERRSILEEG